MYRHPTNGEWSFGKGTTPFNKNVVAHCVFSNEKEDKEKEEENKEPWDCQKWNIHDVDWFRRDNKIEIVECNPNDLSLLRVSLGNNDEESEGSSLFEEWFVVSSSRVSFACVFCVR